MPPRPGLTLKIDSGAPQDPAASFVLGASGTLGCGVLQFRPEGVTLRAKNEVFYKICEEDLKFVSTLGAGASSVVHKALLVGDHQTTSSNNEQQFVAVKKINVTAKELREQMHNDVRVLIDATTNMEAKDTPGLIKFFGAYHSTTTGQIAIVLEYMSGGSLADVLHKVKKIPEAVLATITLTVLKGLFQLHKKMHMVHRDIKPANILLNSAGEPKITDFGISKSMENTHGMANTFLGTVTYMSPERIENKPYGYASDIWSLGLCLVECATGKYPYDASAGPLQLMFQVMQEDPPIPPLGEFSQEFRDFITACLRKNPDNRPSASDLLSHPFILKHRNTPVDMPAFMRSAIDSHGQLDEIAFFFAHNFYRIITLGLESTEHLQALSPLYINTSVFMHMGKRATGRVAITECLQESIGMMQTWGIRSFDVGTVDCSGLPGGEGVLMSVQGYMKDVNGKASPFAEYFTLHKATSGEYYVANQAFRLLETKSWSPAAV